MNEEILIGVIGGGSALLGSIVGAIASYTAAKLSYNAKRNRKGYLEALNDLLVFHEIENLYSSSIAKLTNKPQNAVKIEYRAKIDAEEKGRLSTHSEPARIRSKIESLR